MAEEFVHLPFPDDGRRRVYQVQVGQPDAPVLWTRVMQGHRVIADHGTTAHPRLMLSDTVVIEAEPSGPQAEADLVARGMSWADTERLMREACAQAGVRWDDDDEKPKDIAVNVMQRLANAAHKAGFKLALERARTAPEGCMTDAQLVEHLHARGWRLEPTDVPMVREAHRALGGGTGGGTGQPVSVSIHDARAGELRCKACHGPAHAGCNEHACAYMTSESDDLAFLARLLSMAKAFGNSGDWPAVRDFVRHCHRELGAVPPPCDLPADDQIDRDPAHEADMERRRKEQLRGEDFRGEL